jgi:hypothetical protein
MRSIETIATVTPDGTLTAQVPSDIAPGEHRVVLVLEDGPAQEGERPPFDLPVVHVGRWPDNLSLRREDMYGDWGR